MNIISMLLGLLENHEKEHSNRPKFKIHTLTKGQASGKCLSCNELFGAKQ